MASGAEQPPEWNVVESETFTAAPTPEIQERYDRVAAQVATLTR